MEGLVVGVGKVTALLACVCVAVQCLESILCKSPSPGRGLSWLVETIKSLEHVPALRGQVCRTLVQVSEGGEEEGNRRGGVSGQGGDCCSCRRALQ